MSIEFRRSPALLLCLGVLLAGAVGCGPSATESVAADADAAAPPVAAQPPRTLWLAASHILIQYAGAPQAGTDVTRTREEARKLAGELAAEAVAGADFGELAREHSDGPTAPKGGNLGVFPASRMVPAFSEACALLGVGEVSEPVETKFGFHVIRRDREVEQVSARHILVVHAESARKAPDVTRTKEEGLARAREALEKLRSGGDFAELAAEYSDGPTKVKGGDLGAFLKGKKGPAFDEAVFGLEVGAVSDIVDTQFGYHIIMRYE